MPNSDRYSRNGLPGRPNEQRMPAARSTQQPAPPSARRTQAPQTPQQRRAGAPQRQAPLPKQKGSRWFRAIIMVLATLTACVFMAMFILQSAWDVFGLNQEDMNVNVTIPEGATIDSISEILADKNVVDQPLTFRLYTKLKLEDEEIKAGEYIFNSNMGYDEIIRDLRMGNSEKVEVRITFIEGGTIYEFARQLQEKKVCDADEFLEYLETAELDYEFLDRLPNSSNRFRRMEGYIFPDTYLFYEDEKVANVAAKFLNNFQVRFTSAMEERMQDLNLTMDETIILASIIQREADTADQMKRVSAVFHNRLNRSDVYPNLQSDVTIHYVERFIKPFLNEDDQDLYDAYNTYVCTGLPVGPICNPGLDAIEAALYPADTNNYFFVTDSEGLYYYAETAERHYQNVSEAEAVGGEDIHGTATSRG